MWITLRSRLISVDIKGVDEMKREYVKPVMMGEAFVANEYVAACYHGVCNISGYVFTDTNGNGVYDAGIDKYKYYNTACNHDYWIQGQNSELPAKNAFVFQRIQYNDNNTFWDDSDDYWGGVGNPTPVWNFDETHTTTTMDLQNRPNHS